MVESDTSSVTLLLVLRLVLEGTLALVTIMTLVLSGRKLVWELIAVLHGVWTSVGGQMVGKLLVSSISEAHLFATASS